MKATHTPGPWVVAATLDQVRVDSETHGAIASFGIAPFIDDESRANARLVAAAPELYNAVLAVACDLYVTNRTPEKQRKVCNSLWQICRKLVEKIEGQDA